MRYLNTDDHRLRTTVATESLALPTPVSALEEGQRLATGVSDGRHMPTAQPTAQVRVLLVDDHALIREGLSQLFTLEEDITVVGEAVDGFTALEQIRQLQPDVVLMDIHLPVVDGITITRQIVQQFPGVAVIMLTMHRQHQYIVEAMRNGARGYLLKNTTARDVAQGIRTVHAGGVAISPSLTGVLVNELRRQPETNPTSPHSGQHAAQLSEKEIEIIRYLAAGMSNKEIAERLAYSEKTVKNYLSIIFQKLHLRDRTQVAIFALRQGLLPDEEATE
ncbi:response regulator [Dictyobacter arantiisoli]|uniref:DNA-binding response regulator n=1 Tax=Dictyobacter arantiisoli TaxID=2014874 RepID=A0A5A5THJ1_9CHLR|nr:response regulator transcription factor [Dictyobacter arantiisoli]GCF10434.1 DNA-binding response regulator [Dictyobacter arantiisoli]